MQRNKQLYTHSTFCGWQVSFFYSSSHPFFLSWLFLFSFPPSFNLPSISVCFIQKHLRFERRRKKNHLFVSNSQHNSSPRLLLVKTNTVVFFCLFSFLSPTSLSLDTLPFTWNDKWDLGPARVTIVRYVFRALINVQGRTGELVHMVRTTIWSTGPSLFFISHIPPHTPNTHVRTSRAHTHTPVLALVISFLLLLPSIRLSTIRVVPQSKPHLQIQAISDIFPYLLVSG